MSATHNMTIVGNAAEIAATLHVTIQSGTATTVFASKNGNVVNLVYDSTNGWWECNITSTGTWTVTATDESKTASRSIAINILAMYELSLNLIAPEYTQLEYIESDGTQYINTGYSPTGQSSIVMDCALTNSNDQTFFCARGSNNNVTNTAFYVSSHYRFDYYGYMRASISAYPANTRVMLEHNGGDFYVGEYEFHYATVSTSTAMPWILMAAGRSTDGTTISSLGSYAHMKLYSCKIYSATAIVRDFIPVQRNSDSAVGLYDVVNSVFYPNAGTGTFIAGPAV